MARVTGPIYDSNDCHAGDIADTQDTHMTKGTSSVPYIYIYIYIYDSNHCLTGDIADTRDTHVTKDTGPQYAGSHAQLACSPLVVYVRSSTDTAESGLARPGNGAKDATSIYLTP